MYSPAFIGVTGLLNLFVLGDYVLWLGRRRGASLSCTGGRLESKNVLFEEVLADKFSQVPREAFAVGRLVSLAVMIKTIIFNSRKCRTILDRLWAPYPWLVLDGTEDSLMVSLSRMKCCFVLKAQS